MHNPQTDHLAHDPDRWRHDLGNTLTVISARARLQHRMTLRSSNLTDLERTQSLTNLDAVLAAVEGLTIQIDGMLRACPAHEPPSEEPS